MAAVETTDHHAPVKIKLSVVPGFRKKVIQSWVKKHLSEGVTVISDGLACFNGVTDAGCAHDKIVCGGGRASVEEAEFYWVNTLLGNSKSAVRSTYHSINPKYLQRYLSEFQYLFNRRFKQEQIISRFLYVSVRTPPMPEKLLKIGLT